MDEFKKRERRGKKRERDGPRTKRSGILPFRSRVALDDSFHDPCRPMAKLCGSPSI